MTSASEANEPSHRPDVGSARRGGARLVVRESPTTTRIDGLWWPHERLLSAELPCLFAAWPAAEGHIVKVSYSLWDWDDRPASVAIPNRRGLVGAAALAPTSARLLRLTMLDGSRRRLAILSPDATAEAVSQAFTRLAFSTRRPEWAPRVTPSVQWRRLR